MNVPCRFWMLCAVSLLLAAPAAASAVMAPPLLAVVVDSPVDAGWQTALGLVAEGRIGDTVSDGGNRRTFEIDTGLTTSQSHAMATADFVWQNGVDTPFRLEFDGSGSLFTVGNASVGWNDYGTAAFVIDPGVQFDGLTIRARAAPQTAISFTDLVLDGLYLGRFSHQPDPAAAYLLIDPGASLADGFLLEGQVRLSWDAGTVPRNSHLAFQIAAADTPGNAAVPLPSTLLLLVPALAGVVLCRVRR